MRSTTTAHPGLQSLYNTGSGGACWAFRTGTTAFAAGLTIARFAAERFAAAPSAARRPVVRLVRVARIASALNPRLSFHREFPASVRFLRLFGRKTCNYLRRSTMCLSVRLFRRVFLPNVGKAHGVCG
jgi:hypothetical protein